MSYPWPSELRRQDRPAAKQAVGKRLYFESLESRILLSAEIGVPPGDPFADELMKDRYATLEARYFDAGGAAESALIDHRQSANSSTDDQPGARGKDTLDVPEDWVLPTCAVLDTSNVDVEASQLPQAEGSATQAANREWFLQRAEYLVESHVTYSGDDRFDRVEVGDSQDRLSNDMRAGVSPAETVNLSADTRSAQSDAEVPAKSEPVTVNPDLPGLDLSTHYGEADFLSDRAGKGPRLDTLEPTEDSLLLSGQAGEVTPRTSSGLQVIETGETTPAIAMALIAPPAMNGPVPGTPEDDTFENSSSDSIFQGLAGDDVYLFTNNWGADVVEENPGEGIDTLDFSAVSANLFFSINADGSIDVNDGSNTLSVAGNVENLIGGRGDDTFVFADGAVLSGTITGGRGNDTLDYRARTDDLLVDLGAGDATATTGASGIETVLGGSGDDTITGGASDNILAGGAGADVIDGGGGINTVSFDDATARIWVDLVAGTATVDTNGNDLEDPGAAVDPDEQDTLSNVQNVIGSNFDDIISGDAGDNVIEGGLGDDTLLGGGGDNTVSYAGATSGVTVDLGDLVAQDTVGAGVDTLQDFDSVIGSGYGVGNGGGDTLTGTVGDNRFFVAAGADATVTGVGGTNSLLVDGRGLGVTAAAGSLAFASTPATTITYTDIDDVRIDDAGTDVDVALISRGLQALADRLNDLEEAQAAFAELIPLADPLGVTFGELQNFGRVMQELVSDFIGRFVIDPDASPGVELASSAEVADFLADWMVNLQERVDGTVGNEIADENIRGTLSWLATSLGTSSQTTLNGAGDVSEIRFFHGLASDRDSEMDLGLSGTLRDEAVALADQTVFDFASGFELDFTFGLSGLDGGTLGFFVEEDSFQLASTASLADGPADISADALIGFMEGSVDGPITTLSASADGALAVNDGIRTLAELQVADAITAQNAASTIDAALVFTTAPNFANAALGDGLIEFRDPGMPPALPPGPLDFLNDGLQVILPGESEDFAGISPNELLRLLDELGGWLAGLAESEILDLNVPFAGNTTIGDLLDYGEAFSDQLFRFLVDHDGFRLSQDLLDGLTVATPFSFRFVAEVETAGGATDTYEVELNDNIQTGEQLRSAISAALATAIGDASVSDDIEVFLEGGRIGLRPTSDASNVLAVSLPMVGNESLGFDGEQLIVPTSVREFGLLGHELEFTLNVGDDDERVIRVAPDENNQSLDDLIVDINAELVLQGLGDVTVALGQGSTRELAFSVAENPTIGRAILVDVRSTSSLVDGLVDLGVETAGFVSAQDLADRLGEIFSGSTVTVNFDVANREMSFDVSLAQTFDIASLPIDLSVDLGEFIDIESASELGVSANVALDFTFGVDFASSQELVVAPPVSVPALPDDGVLLNNANFDLTLLQQNFLEDDRLSGGALSVGAWGGADGITVGDPPIGVTWTPPASGVLFDSDNQPLPDHFFFLRVTDGSGTETFVDGVLLSRDTEDNSGVPALADDLASAIDVALAARGFDGLQVLISGADENGFSISAIDADPADATDYSGYRLQLVTAGEFRIADISGVSVPTTVTTDNSTIGDLVEDVQSAIDDASAIAGFEQVNDTLLGLTGPISLTDGGSAAIGNIVAAENGVLERDVRFEIMIGNDLYRGVVSADSTIDNERENTGQGDPIVALASDVTAALNEAVSDPNVNVTFSVTAHPPLGQEVVDLRTDPAVPDASTGVSAVLASGVLDQDVAFTLTLEDGTEVTGVVAVEDTSGNADSAELADDVESAINDALEDAGFGGVQIDVVANADDSLQYALSAGSVAGVLIDFSDTPFQRLEFAATGSIVDELHFFTPAVVSEFSGNRVGLFAVPILAQPDSNTPAKLLGRRIAVDADFDDAAFQELGLLSSPIPANGVLDTVAVFNIIVDGQEFEVTVSPNSSNESVGDLIRDINAALNTALASLGANAVQARQVMLFEDMASDGNRIEFFTAPGSAIRSLTLPALADDPGNSAISQLGFSTTDDFSARAQSGEFFIRDASLSGGLNLDASDIDASAVVGLGGEGGLGLGVEVVDSTGGVFGDVAISLVNPDETASAADATRISLGTLWDYLGTADLPLADIVDAEITGGVAIALDVAPIVPIRTPIEPASIDIGLELPDWLGAPPSLDDASEANGIAVNVSGLDLNIYDALSNLTFSDVVDALQEVLGFLRDLQGEGDSGDSALAAILDQPLPLLNQSPTDLLVVADQFATLVDEVIANPASSLGRLETLLEDLLGLPEELVTLGIDLDDGIALRVDLVFNAGVQESFGFDLDIEDLVSLTDADSTARTLLEGVTSLVGVSSTGDLSVGVDGTVRLSFGIALGNGNGSAEALGFKDGATSTDGVLTASGNAQPAADRLVDQDIEFELEVDGQVFLVNVMAGDQTSDPVEVDLATLLSELKDAPELQAGPDIRVTLRDGSDPIDIDLNPLPAPLDDPSIADILLSINDASDSLTAVFSEELQRILIEDTSPAAANSEQSGVFVTQTDVDEFDALQFSLRVGIGQDPVPVSVAAATGITRKQWLASIDEAIRQAMVDAGQLNPVADAIVDVAYNGTIRQLTFQGTGDGFGERLTIFRGGVFSIENIDTSDAASQLGLDGSDDDGDRTIVGKELRTDDPADTGGLVADVQRAIREAMMDQGNPPIVTVSLLDDDPNDDDVGRLEFTTDPGSELIIRSVSQTLAPFLYNGPDGTAFLINAGASGDNLEFTAQVGPFGFFVIDGGANLDAFFQVALDDTGDTSERQMDGRTYFGQDDFAISTDYGGSASAELPLFFPTESTPINDDDNTLDILVPDLLAFLGRENAGGGFDRDAGSVTIETPDLTAFPTPTLIGMLSNPEFIIDGLDSVLLSIQDALDGEIYGVDLPLIGDGLAPAGQFIADFREDVLTYLSLKLREGGLNPVTLVQETLYNIFADEQDGDPEAVAVLGFAPGDQRTGSLQAATAITSGALARDAELNITVGNDDATRVVVLAENIDDDSPEALVEAINNALKGRGLDDRLTADFEADGNGGFFVRFDAINPNDNILIETAGAIPLDLFGLSVGALGLVQNVSGLPDSEGGLVDINDIVKSGFGLFDEFGQFDFLLGDSYLFGQSLDFDLGLPLLNFDLDAGVEVDFNWDLAFGFGVSQEDGFYFVAGDDNNPETPDLLPDVPEELLISVDVNLLGVLGFSPGRDAVSDVEADESVITGTTKVPANGRFSGDVVFTLDVGGTLSGDITILASATADNRSAENLVDDINAALAAAGGVAGQVTARLEVDADGELTGRLQFVTDSATSLTIYNSATATGQLGFLIVDAIDRGRIDPQSNTRQFSGLNLELAVDIIDPGSGSSADGRLTFSEISSSSTELSDILAATARGGATLDLGLMVSFGDLGLDSAFLPAIGTDLVLDWEFAFDTRTGSDIGTPDVSFDDITLDLGSFISDFAGPFLEDIAAFIEPLGFLIDKQDGLLYKRLPVISDLAGQTVTLKQLAETLDRENRIVPFLNALEQVYFLVDLVGAAAGEANADGSPILLEFGSLSFSSEDLSTLQNEGKSIADANPAVPTPMRTVDQFNSNANPSTQNTRSFTSSVTRPGSGSISFDILKPANIIDLLLGKPDVDLVTYDLPPFGFNFEYLQRFPIYPPLFATLRGYFSASIDLGFGYDALGLTQFLDTENPLDLINGFFLTDVENGVDIPEVTLVGGIAAGASLDIAVASAGVEGGIEATILFNLNDPDQDTKVRLSEMLGNILLNNFNPIAVFDTSGRIDAFLRAYVEVLFGLWSAEYEIGRVNLASFDIPFARPPILAQNIGDGVLQLNMGTASENRIHGSLADGDETIFVRYESGSVYVAQSQGGPEQRFVGINQIKVDAGAGDDIINLAGLGGSGIAVEVRGGTGDDTITGASASSNIIFGGEGNDTITGGSLADEIHGGEGNDIIRAGLGADLLVGGAGADEIFGGDGDDDIDGGAGADLLTGGGGNDVYRFGGNFGEDEVVEATLSGGDADTWDFLDTATDLEFALGDDARVGSVEEAVLQGSVLRITSTRHGLSSGDQVNLSGIRGLDGNAVDLPTSVIVNVDPADPDSFTVTLGNVPASFEHDSSSGIFQLDRSALTIDEIRNADDNSDDMLIQVETNRRHGLESGDIVTLGEFDPLSGEAVLAGQTFTVTVVDSRTFNLDDTEFENPTFNFDNAFVQRQETGTGLVENVAVSPGLVTVSSTNHGLADGDEITITGSQVEGWLAGDDIPLNNVFVVDVTSDDTFTISLATADTDLLSMFGPAAIDTGAAIWQINRTYAESVGNSVLLNGYGIENIVGGRGGDVFDVYQTAAQQIVLDGAGGSDTYRAYAIEPRIALGASSNTRLFDNGNPWDTDVALFFGSEGGDRLLVDNSNITTDIDRGDDNPTFAYGEPNIVVGFQSGKNGVGTVAGDALDSGALDRNARILLTVGDERPILVEVEPDDVVDPATVADLINAINAAIGQTVLDGVVTAGPRASDPNMIEFTATEPTAMITVENLSQGSGIEALELETLGGDDQVDISSTNSRTSVRVSGGLGNDDITVGGPADMNTVLTTVNGIRGSILTGPLVIDGNEGVNTLFVSDADDDQANTGTLTDTILSGLGMEINIEYTDFASIGVQLGEASDQFTVESTIAGTTSVSGGAEADRIDIESVSGILNVAGEDGADAITLQTSDAGSTSEITGGADNDAIDVRTMQGNTIVLGGSGDDVIRVGSMAGLNEPGSVNLINGLLDISGGTGSDSLFIDDTADGSTTLVAQSALSGRASENGRLSGDARFNLDFGNGDVSEILVDADQGSLRAAAAVTASAQADGVLGSDAFFVLMVGDERFDVTVQRDTGNQSVDDLVDDINASLDLVGIDATRVTARIDGDTLVIDSLQGEDLRLEVETDDAAATELGFADDSEAVFDNNSAADLEADINDALAAAGVAGEVVAEIDVDTGVLSFNLLSGDFLRLIIDDGDAAESDLGLVSGQLLQPNNTGTLRVNELTGRAELVGLGMGVPGDGLPGIVYRMVASVNISLGSGNDEFNVQGTLNDEAPALQSMTTLDTGSGDDVINVSDTAPSIEADRGHLNGDLDAVQGELNVLAGAGHNTLNVSDREATTGDSGVIITSDRIEGLAPGVINYAASAGFSGGINIWAGTGADTARIESTLGDDVTTLFANGGDDRITIIDADVQVEDGLLILEGGAGDDFIDGSFWNSTLFVFGDLGEVEYADRTRALDQVLSAATIQIDIGGNDQLFGGSANDVLLGGTASDSISGGQGDDAILGDGGRVSFGNGEVLQIEATDFFIGGGDRLAGGLTNDDSPSGGDGNDVIIGGAGFDLLFGTLAEDILIYEYGRVTYVDGLAETVVVLGQRPLDLAASTLFDLYLKDRFLVSPYMVGEVSAERAPIEVRVVDVSTGPVPYSAAYQDALCLKYLAEVAFELNSSTLTPESADYLRQAAAFLADLGGVVVQVSGHADSLGSDEVNQRLSLARAQAVVDALTEYGVNPAILRAFGYGEERPVADNETEEGRAANRRVEIEVDEDGACQAPDTGSGEGASGLGLLALTGWRSTRGAQQQSGGRCIRW